MANPRQRRKARSSSHRPVSAVKNGRRHLKKTPSVRGPKVLQDAWDRSKTTKQNYAAFGLVHSLNPSASGGSERPESPETPPSSSMDPTMKGHLAFGKIIRSETGEIVRVEMNENNISPDLEQHTSSVDSDALPKWAASIGTQESVGAERTVVKGLECVSVPQTASNTLSYSLSGAGPRFPSAGEVAYLRRLVEKYGDNVEKMFKDRKLNPDQRTVGQLRNGLRRAGFSGSA